MTEQQETPEVQEEEDDEYIVPPEAVEPKGEPAANPPEETPKDDSTSEEEEKPQEPEVKTDSSESSVSIDGREYSREELETIFEMGKKVHEYQKYHPGFDPVLLHRDYTKKSMELAELKKQSQPAQQTAAAPSAKKPIDEVAKELGVNAEDVKLVEKVVKSLGYVSQDELQTREVQKRQAEYEQQKNKAVNDFVAKHPKYHPANDPGDKNWQSFLNEFQFFKIPDDPNQIGALLERVHRSLDQTTISPEQAAKILAQKKVNKVGQVSSGGTSGSTSTSKTSKVPSTARKALKGFSEEELEEMFAN